jgi:cytochrome c-type biogenesis protein CcmE
MKKSYIIGLIVVAIFAAILVATLGQTSSYECFDSAESMFKDGDKGEVHVMGELVKNADGSLKNYVYDPLVDANKSQFMVRDSCARTEQILLLKSIPIDFEKSEKVVLMGKFTEQGFVAKDVLTKCPSKYENKSLEK